MIEGECYSLDFNHIAVKIEVQGDKCGLCGVGVFTSRSDLHLQWVIGGTQTLVETIMDHPIETTTKKMGVLAVLPAWKFLLGVLFYWHGDVCAVLH